MYIINSSHISVRFFPSPNTKVLNNPLVDPFIYSGMISFHPPAPGFSRFRAIFPYGILGGFTELVQPEQSRYFSLVFNIVFLVLSAVIYFAITGNHSK